ncbi:MAG TPA: hypothetical protein ENI85_05540 [Deltaproteobacteria bacterium]|nr:hypothetical protein [Deltaproteobacteria bacterium]
MAVAETPHACTALRSLEIRTRTLPLEAQMVECVDLLQSPEFVVDDLLRSVEQIRAAGRVAGRVRLECDEEVESGAFFYPSRELFVQGDGCSFTCLATSVAFTDGETAPAPPEEEIDPCRDRIDYAAVTCESRPFPVLGFTQSAENESAYPILLRSLSNLIELTRPLRFEVLDRQVYRGILGPAPVFDLALVLWDEDDEADPRRPLCELARDLAEVLKSTLRAEARFPPILNDVVCLRMNPKRFDGRLRYVWRV